MRYFSLLFICFLVLGSCQSSNSAADSNAEETPTDPKAEKRVTKAKTLPPRQYAAELAAMNSEQLIDVRTEAEYKSGFIDGATNIDFYSKTFANDLRTQLDVKRPVFVYCKSGGRSGKTAQQLLTMGFKEVYDLQGGYTAWMRAQKNRLPEGIKAADQ